ncbi:hypothetical protein XFUD_03745 [Xylella fastidiosa]|nr:hypothetical protein XFUD_03745 [Xylella fastidiosa]OCA58565.1 hypothetical protein AA93_03710 [Xylella fastidiosa subsp. pauca 11399]ALR02024.1 hypothetical protein OY18_07045 [Xylella fastidiosa]ALR02613.1 hypothetical protein OY18_10860 [Xylella fastidiosa]ALR02937.1 hypothetical protein OY18_12860 [Xylella fastidiosa]
MAGIDDAAAVAGDAGGVGNDELGAVASHFQIAMQLAGTPAVDFVEDDFGGAGGQPGVALDGARQVGLGRGAGVVEDGALWGDVKLLVGVTGDARLAGGLDVDEGGAVGGGKDGRALVAWGVGVGDDLGGGNARNAHPAEAEPQGKGDGMEAGTRWPLCCSGRTWGTAGGGGSF